MLVRLVSAVLQRFLGQYVENLDTERLSYSLGYSGNVVLTDLHLKTDALSQLLGLPVLLKSSHIARVQLSIPLTQLRSQPWSITIEDADLVVYPSDITSLDPPESQPPGSTDFKMVDESRKAVLERLESRWWQVVKEGGLINAVATTSPSDSSWWSYGVSLIYGIVSNLHVEIRNVRFTFLDETNLIGQQLVWGIQLEKMAIQATDENWDPSGRPSVQNVEFKSIDIIGFAVFYQQQQRHGDPQQLFLIPPSQFCVHLQHHTCPEPLTSATTPRIEVQARLAALHLDVSQSVLGYARRLLEFFRKQTAPSHRPRVRPGKDPRAWWRYAASSLMPGLRHHIHCQHRSSSADGCQPPLQELVAAAAVNNRYVRAYEVYLLKGLAVNPRGDAGTTEPQEVDHSLLESSMSLERVVMLRQVAMQRAANVLKQQKSLSAVRTPDSVMTLPTSEQQPSRSWWPSFLSSSNQNETSNQSSVEEEAPRPWRLWWWCSTTDTKAVTASSASSIETGEADASGEAALMLLNELVAARDVGQVLTMDRVFCRLTCSVEEFHLGLQEENGDSGQKEGLCSLGGSRLQLCLETRPREESLHFSALLGSILVRDERCPADGRRPLFPTVISLLNGVSDDPTDGVKELFRLDYTTTQAVDVGSVAAPPAMLSIRTDPLRVVCQPELITRVIRFFAPSNDGDRAAVANADQASAYATLKSQTKANLRAALHNAEKVDEAVVAEAAEVGVTPSSSQKLQAPSQVGSPLGLRLQLDIAAPRILLPECLWTAESGDSTPSPEMLGVICDLGRFRMSNWEPSEEKEKNRVEDKRGQLDQEAISFIGNHRMKPLAGGYNDGDNDDEFGDETEDFATPCATPVASDSEETPVDLQRRPSSIRRTRVSAQRRQRLRLYETYLLELDEFRVLAGRLDELQMSGIWPGLLPKSSTHTHDFGRHISHQVNLVDRFSLAIWITRRLVPMARLRSLSSSLPAAPATIPSDLPGLLISLEQRHCVLKLSDARLAALRRCLTASGLSHQSSVPSPPTYPPTPPPTTKIRVSATTLGDEPGTPKLRRTVMVTFSMQELILQLDARGRPLAEARLGWTAARFVRSRGDGITTYEVCALMRSLTVADALCGLGGDFDLLAASHRDVRLDTLSGSLSVSDGAGAYCGRNRQSFTSSTSSKGPFTTVTHPFFDPIGDEEALEDSSTALIRVKYHRTFTAYNGRNKSSVDFKFRHLDLLGNLNTLLELMAFVRCVMPKSEESAAAAAAVVTAKSMSDRHDDASDDTNTLEMSVSVERLSLVLIRVKDGALIEQQLAEGEEEEDRGRPGLRAQPTAERLATITLLGANFKSTGTDHRDLRVSLAGLQVLDLMDIPGATTTNPSPHVDISMQHRYIFAAGRCLDPELDDASNSPVSWGTTKSVFTLTTSRVHSHTDLDLVVSSPVYVHKPRTLHEISAWFSHLYHWNVVVDDLARRLATSEAHQSEAEKVNSSSPAPTTAFRAVFEQPVVVLPAAPTSTRVLITRLGQLTLQSTSGAGAHSDFQFCVAKASLSALDLTQIRRVRGTSETVQAMLVLAHYLRLVTATVTAEMCVLKDISADVMVRRNGGGGGSGSTGSETVQWPEDFDYEALNAPFEGVECSVPWIAVSACLTQPLHVRLTKSVYHQLLETLDNLTYSGGESEGSRGSEVVPTRSDTTTNYSDNGRTQVPPSPGVAMRFRMPELVVETFAPMGGEIEPVGLTRLNLKDFFIAAARSPAGITHMEATLASVVLENCLPDFTEDNRYLLYSHLPSIPPVSPRQLQMVTSRSCPSLIETNTWPYHPWGDRGVDDGFTLVTRATIGRGDRRNAKAAALRGIHRHTSLSFNEWAVSSATRKRHSSVEPRQAKKPIMDEEDTCCVDGDVHGDQFVRIRVLLVDQSSPLLVTKYQSTRRFVDVAFSSLTCNLSLHPWVLLVDFLGLNSPLSACDKIDNTDAPSITVRERIPGKDLNTEEGKQETLAVLTLSVSTFALRLFAAEAVTPLLRACIRNLRVRLTNHELPVTSGGEWMELSGRLAAVSVHDLTPNGSRLYPLRFLTIIEEKEDDYLVFKLTKHQLPDAEATWRSEDGCLELRLGPAYYVHTQDWLLSVVDALDKFLQYQDLMNRVRASAEGYRVRQGAPISMRLRLDVKADAPIIVVPVSAQSEQAIVCDLGTLTAVNDFQWWRKDAAVEGVLETENFESPEQQTCKHCTGELWWSDASTASSGVNEDIMTQGFYPASAIPKDTDSDDSPCLVDRIELSLDHIEIYIGKRSSCLSDDTQRTLRFGSAFCIIPDPASSLMKPGEPRFSLSALVERNLCGSRGCHGVPDWRLAVRLRTFAAPLCVSQRDLALFKGILTHNISSGPAVGCSDGASVGTLTISSTVLQTIISEKPETVCTCRPYRVLSFTFDLEDVVLCLTVPSNWPSQRHLITNGDVVSAPFCRLDLTRSRLSFESFSCGRRIIDLSCSEVTFNDTRFEESVEPKNHFPIILTALQESQPDREPSPQFRVTQIVTPLGGANSDESNSGMTFQLRSMRLILALDWLVDLQRYLSTQAVAPSSETCDSSETRCPMQDSVVMAEEATEQDQASSASSGAPQGVSTLRVFADETEFVVMEDPADLDTNTVVLKGALCFMHRTGGGARQDLVHLGLHGVSLQTLHGFSDASRTVIVEPTDVTVSMVPPVLQKASKLPSPKAEGLQDLLAPKASLEVRTSTIRTHFSYNDGLLFWSLCEALRAQAAYAFGRGEKLPDAAAPVGLPDTALDASVAQLVEMGFAAEEAVRALRNTSGRLSAAISALTEPATETTETPPQSQTVLWLRSLLNCLTQRVADLNFHSGFSLCLIDDCMDADVPLAEIIVSDISMKWCLTGWAIGRVLGRLSVKYYNRDLSALEPALEPFLCICDWRLRLDDATGEDCAMFEVHSPDTINVNLTVALVQLTQLVVKKTEEQHRKRGRGGRARAPFVPFCLVNCTGEILRFRKATGVSLSVTGSAAPSKCSDDADDDDDWTVVEEDACVELPFPSVLTATGRGQGHSDLEDIGRLRSRTHKIPRLQIQVEGWAPAYPVALDRLGVFTRTIRLLHTQASHLTSVTRLVIEIVRRGSAQNLVIVRSGLTVTNRLSPVLDLEIGLAIITPLLGGAATTVVRRSGVRVAFGETRGLPLSLVARSGSAFERLCFRPVMVKGGGEIFFDWSRQIVPDTTGEFGYGDRGGEHSEIGAGMRLVEPTSTEDLMEWRKLTKPGDFDEAVMSCRRLKSGTEIGLYSATAEAAPKSPSVSTERAQKQLPWQFCVTAVRDAFPLDPVFVQGPVVLPSHHLTVGPVLRIVNLLPCEVTYFLDGTPIRSRIPPNKAASVFEASCAAILKLGIHLEGFRQCEPIHIPPATITDTVLLNLYDQFGRLLQLKAEVCTRAFNARHVTLSAVCWLINQTGLPLVFSSQAPSSLASDTEWKCPGSPEHRCLAAGQSEEQEIARLASPLLFSPIPTSAAVGGTPTGVSSASASGVATSLSGSGVAVSRSDHFPSSWGLQVRLGARYEFAEGQGIRWLPRWCPLVALDRPPEALMLRLKAVGPNQSRPDLLFSVGVEVRKGTGLHSATTIVTFVPRFVVSNQTNFQLQYAQRFCLDSSVHKPMDIHPNCSAAFHWPRQDLDQLLCFRALLSGDNWLPDQSQSIPASSSSSSDNSARTLVATHWSGGVQIDKPRSYHLMLRMPSRPQTSSGHSTVEPLFLRVDVVLRGATFFVITTDATHLPSPYRIENRSPVALFYQQSVGNGVSEGPLAPFPSSSSSTTQGTNGRWTGGIRLNRLPPRSVVSYAPEEPMLPPCLSVGVQGDLSTVYDLSRPQEGPNLVYDNCLYIGIFGVAGDKNSDASPPSGYGSVTFEFPVLDVPSDCEYTAASRRVVLRRKRPGERSQLWYLSSQGLLVHEGSSAPQAPSANNRGRRGRVLSSKSSWVLDVDTSESTVRQALVSHPVDPRTFQNFEVGILTVTRLSKMRQNTQTWSFDRGFLINKAAFCVQAPRKGMSGLSGDVVYVTRPRSRIVGAQSLLSWSLAAARIFYTWLRPGSGSLKVEVLTEGPVRVLRISDPQELRSDLTTKTPHGPPTHSTTLKFLLDLPGGIAVSVISARCEELCYASFLGIRFSLDRYYPGNNAIDAGHEVEEVDSGDPDTVFIDAPAKIDEEKPLRPVEDTRLHISVIQIDNQIAGASLPILLFRAVGGSSQKNVLEGRSLAALDGIRGRELERLFFRVVDASSWTSSGDRSSVSTQAQPNLVLRSLRLLHTGWKAEIFTLFQIQLHRMVVQAEELLLLKLIQFSRHFRGSTNTTAAIVTAEDAKSIDFPAKSLLEPAGSYTRQVSAPDMTTREFLYFDRLQILIAPIKVTVQTAQGRLGPEFYDVQRLLPKLLSFTDADLRMGEFVRVHCLESSGCLMEQLTRHFKEQLRGQALRIFGSVDVLGNPLGLFADLSSGISDLAEMDFSGLVRNLAHGVGDSTAKVVGSMSQLVHTLSMDEHHQRRRRAIMAASPRHVPVPAHPATAPASSFLSRRLEAEATESLDEFVATGYMTARGEAGALVPAGSLVAGGGSGGGAEQTGAAFRAGLRGFVHGVVGGVTSIVMQPIHGVCEDESLKGFVMGVGRGLLGTVTKPVGGVLDLVSGAMTSLREAARPSASGRPRRMRPRRALARPLRPYALTSSVAQLLLRRLAYAGGSNDYAVSSIGLVDVEAGATVCVEDLEEEGEGFSVNRLLTASLGQQWEFVITDDDRPEMVTCVLRCQSGAVSVIVTDRAVWCVRNFTLQGVQQATVSSSGSSKSFFSNASPEATRVMFVIPYSQLNRVRLNRQLPLSQGDRFQLPRGAPQSSPTVDDSDSAYVEFELVDSVRPPRGAPPRGRRCRALRFDRRAWAAEVVAEVSEAHFRFVQRAMELRCGGEIFMTLGESRRHPLVPRSFATTTTTTTAVEEGEAMKNSLEGGE